MKSIMGMDLATRESGFCVIPADWDGDPSALICDGVGYDLAGKIPEQSKIQAMLNAAKVAVRMFKEHSPAVIGLEAPALHIKSTAASIQVEIGAIVKSQILLAADMVPSLVNASTARKFLTGGIRGKRREDRDAGIKVLPAKQQVKNFLTNRGMVFDTDDQMDAFVVAFYLYCVVNQHIPCEFAPIEEHEQIGPPSKRRTAG